MKRDDRVEGIKKFFFFFFKLKETDRHFISNTCQIAHKFHKLTEWKLSISQNKSTHHNSSHDVTNSTILFVDFFLAFTFFHSTCNYYISKPTLKKIAKCAACPC